MAHISAIEWTNSTWNPVVGCRKVSAGCKNCYAERMAKRLCAMARAAQSRGRSPGRAANYLHVVDRDGHWNGRVFLDDSAVTDPLGWAKPRMIFVNSMSDLFHEDVPLGFIQAVFDVMHRCPQHIFQILTKRPHIAARYSERLAWTPNIWMGTTVENATVTHRIRDLRATPARIKFLSLEPLLGPIGRVPLSGIDWVIVGGESGPGARPMNIEWVRPIRDRCVARGVSFFFKQWGGVNKKRAGRRIDGRTWGETPPVPLDGGYLHARIAST
jgi:protein gp37